MARIETTETSIKLVERRESDGLWLVRWDFQPKPNAAGVYWYEEESYNFIPTIDDIYKTIVEWHNKQTNGIIQNRFTWKGIDVFLSDENKFNFAFFTIEAERREKEIKDWDLKHPEIAGKEFIEYVGIDKDGNQIVIKEPTGRKSSRLPVTFKLSESNDLSSFYIFTTVEELKEFTSASTDHLNTAYAAGWTKIATFDWTPYIQALQEL